MNLQLTETLYSYVVQHAPVVNPVLPKLAQETRSLPNAVMQIAPDQGAFMHLLAKLIGATKIIEVGCFTGYSAICMASALPAGGKLYTLDVDEKSTSIAKRYFAEAGLADKIELRLGPALDALPKLEKELGAGQVDLMFIDADKPNMWNYFEWGLKLVRQGGLILADNALFGGAVADPNVKETNPAAIRAFNEKVKADERVDRVLLNIADGIYLCRKR